MIAYILQKKFAPPQKKDAHETYWINENKESKFKSVNKI